MATVPRAEPLRLTRNLQARKSRGSCFFFFFRGQLRFNKYDICAFFIFFLGFHGGLVAFNGELVQFEHDIVGYVHISLYANMCVCVCVCKFDTVG